MMQLGDWDDPEVSGLQLSMREELEMIESYIPQYFKDDAPLGIMLSGAFMYTPFIICKIIETNSMSLG